MLTAKVEDVFGVDAATFFELFLAHEAFEQAYHKKLNHEEVKISPWEVVGDGFRRTIDFSTPFNGPAIIKKMLGKVSTTQVKATQFYSWSADKRELTYKQKNVIIGVPMADCFAVEETSIVTEDGSASCKFVSVARVEFTGRLPGAKGSIEKTMFKESENAQTVWNGLAKTTIDKHKGIATGPEDSGSIDSDREADATPEPSAGGKAAAPSPAEETHNQHTSAAGDKLIEVSIVSAQAVKPDEEKEYTEYVIEVKGPASKWSVKRRYRQFDSLNRSLHKRFGRKLKAQMPKKQVFGSMSASVVELRRKALEQYVRDVIANPDVGITDADIAAFLDLNNTWRAAADGDVRVLKLALDSLRGDINGRNEFGDTPLVCATSKGREDVSLMLIERGADVNGQGQAGESPLVGAATQGLEKTVIALIAKKALVECRDRVGGTPLYYAALNGHVNIVKLLIAAGADTNSQDKGGETPIYAASHQGHVDVVEALLQAGADPQFASIHADSASQDTAAAPQSTAGNLRAYGSALNSATPGTEVSAYSSQLIAAFIRAPPAETSDAARKLRAAVSLELELTRRLITAKFEAVGSQLGPGMDEARKNNASLKGLDVMSKRLASQLALLRAHIDEAIDAALPDIQGVSATAPSVEATREDTEKASEVTPEHPQSAPSTPLPSVKSLPAAIRLPSMSPSSNKRSTQTQLSPLPSASSSVSLQPRVRSKTLLVPLVPFKSLHNLSAAVQPVTTIRFARAAPFILAFASTSGSIAVTHATAEELKHVATLTGHNGAVNDFDITADGASIVSVGSDKTVRIWSVKDGKCVATFPTKREVNAVIFHPQHQDFYLYGNNKNSLVSCMVEGGKRCQKLALKAPIKSIAIDHTGELLFVGDSKGTITTVSVKMQSGSLKLKDTAETVVAKGYGVTSICYKPPSVGREGLSGAQPTELALLLVNSCDNVLRVFIVQNNGQLRILKQFPVFQETLDIRACFGSPIFGANEELLVFSGSEDGRVHTFDLCRRETPCVNKLTGHAKAVLAVAWSSGANLLASADAAGNVIIWGHE
eukprot:Opistho-2@82662